MGKGKLVKFHEMETFEHVVQEPYRKIQESNFYLKGQWALKFFKNCNPIVLELGCGKGEYTVELAGKFPDKNFLGVDIKGARIWKGAKLSIEKGLKNVGFLRTNIEIITQFFASGEVDEIWITFPDPQMKKSNKRLTSSSFISKYKEFLSEKGLIHLKTDSNFMYQYTCALVEENNFEIKSKTDNLYNSDLLDDVLEIKTFYEKQWLGRGMAIKYLAFTIHKNIPYSEPAEEFKKDDYRSYGRIAREIIKDE